jgi:CDP-diacylglycerol---glycerol-3-phosphate 3-phosphatidyltransferase
VNLPNALTLTRIFLVPLIVVVLLTTLPSQWSGVPQQILGVGLFLTASITDWLDGHLARLRGQVSTLGILLDPIADKLLISAAFITLVEARLAPAWAVVIIIGREFAVSGLRSIAAAEGFTITASRMGKFKMLTQVVAITLLILGSRTAVSGDAVGVVPPIDTAKAFASVSAFATALDDVRANGKVTLEAARLVIFAAGRVMLWVVVVTALWSMADYFRRFYGKIRDHIEVRERRTRFRLLRRRPRSAGVVTENKL